MSDLDPTLFLRDVGRVLGVGVDRAWQLEKAGELAIFELFPRLGNRRRYSRKKLQAYLDGQPLDTVANAVDGGPRLALPGRRR